MIRILVLATFVLAALTSSASAAALFVPLIAGAISAAAAAGTGGLITTIAIGVATISTSRAITVLELPR